ncbi:MAG: hypothetical protein QOI01_735 [Mycobacterium sp.]|jgi:hypothetical protein|nr:hypothetical protein [Mycobacterium sp.]
MGNLGRRPFIASEALAAGIVKKHQLRREFLGLLPDVYVDADVELTLELRATAVWLWSHRQGVIAGLTAAGLHGAKWVDDPLPIELIWSNARRPPGVRVFDLRLAADELTARGLMRVTTPARTAFDIGRRGRLDHAVARLDALGNATRFAADDVVALAARHRGARGLRQLPTALELYDPGAASPKETWLRLLLIRAGFPRPQSQIPAVGVSGRQYYLDMGWEDLMVAVEYDGDQHRLDRRQFVKDILRLEELRDLGWIVVRVVAENNESEIIDRVHRARESRLR